MKIGISLLDFQPGNSGGIETYGRDLISGLELAQTPYDFFILLDSRNAGSIKVTNPRFKIIYCDKRSVIHRGINKLKIADFSIDKMVATTISHLQLDILHFPLQTIRESLQKLPVKKINSIMDIQQEYMPGNFVKEDLAFRKKAYISSCNVSDHIISISKFTKRSLVDKFGIDPHKITTVYLNYNEELYNSAVQNSHMVEGKYLFYPAATWPHKNHIRLIKAFFIFHKKHSDFKLVLTGVKKQKSKELYELVSKLGIGDAVNMLGYLSYDELPGVFKAAYGLIFPSLFEGFGIPILESMAVGCPVAASKVTSIPEVAGNAALYFNPTNTKSIEGAMTKLVENRELRSKLINRGFSRVKEFTKADMVINTLNVYEKVARM